MTPPPHSIIETRYDQMFPTLLTAEIEHLRRFGEPRSYAAGEHVVKAGETSPGWRTQWLTIVLTSRASAP